MQLWPIHFLGKLNRTTTWISHCGVKARMKNCKWGNKVLVLPITLSLLLSPIGAATYDVVTSVMPTWLSRACFLTTFTGTSFSTVSSTFSKFGNEYIIHWIQEWRKRKMDIVSWFGSFVIVLLGQCQAVKHDWCMTPWGLSLPELIVPKTNAIFHILSFAVWILFWGCCLQIVAAVPILCLSLEVWCCLYFDWREHSWFVCGHRLQLFRHNPKKTRGRLQLGAEGYASTSLSKAPI